MKNKVFIIIEKGRYTSGINDEKEYTAVGFMASTYGSANPCDTPEQIEDAIRHSKEWITREGDIPIVDNKIETRTLDEWANETVAIGGDPAIPEVNDGS